MWGVHPLVLYVTQSPNRVPNRVNHTNLRSFISSHLNLFVCAPILMITIDIKVMIREGKVEIDMFDKFDSYNYGFWKMLTAY